MLRIQVIAVWTSAVVVALVISFSVRSTKASDTSSPRAQSSGPIPGWGEIINPDGDCALAMAEEKVTIALPGNDHVLRPERHKMNAPRVLQPIVGEFDIQVKISGDFSPKASSVVPGRPAYQDAGLLVWLDDKNNLKLSRAEIILKGRTINFFNLEFRHEGEYGEVPWPREARRLLQAKTVYLRLQIHAAGTTAGVSGDGKNWVTTSLPGGNLPEKLQTGILAENNTSSPFTAAFEGLTVSTNSGK